MWKQCFSGIVAVPVGLEGELGVCERAIAASSTVNQVSFLNPKFSRNYVFIRSALTAHLTRIDLVDELPT